MVFVDNTVSFIFFSLFSLFINANEIIDKAISFAERAVNAYKTLEKPDEKQQQKLEDQFTDLKKRKADRGIYLYLLLV